jgi:2-dehydropantoate 2-reductase
MSHRRTGDTAPGTPRTHSPEDHSQHDTSRVELTHERSRLAVGRQCHDEYNFERRCVVRILVVGAGVIGSVYAGRLLDAGHSVTLCARGHRLAELRQSGLILEDAHTGRRTSREVAVVTAADASLPCDLVLVAVRRDDMLATLPPLQNLQADVMFFGNAAGLTTRLSDAMAGRALFGFPAAAGVRDAARVRFVLIRQQKTMLANTDHRRSPRVRALAAMFRGAGFPTTIASDAEAWLTAHAALVVRSRSRSTALMSSQVDLPPMRRC